MNLMDERSRIEMLERTIMELGSELYQIKGIMLKSKEGHERFLGIVKGLKQLLDDKGLITTEDFDAAVQLGEAIEVFNSQAEHAAYNELEKLKKQGH